MTNGRIHSFPNQPSDINGGSPFSPLHDTPPHLLQYPRDRSSSAPMAPQTFIYQQLALTPTTPTEKSNGVVSQRHKHGLSSPSLHTLTQSSHAPASPSPSPHSTRRQTQNQINEDDYLKALISAMSDMTSTEDNPGMLDTWRKIMKAKKHKVERVCRDMLVKSPDLLFLNRFKCLNRAIGLHHEGEQTRRRAPGGEKTGLCLSFASRAL